MNIQQPLQTTPSRSSPPSTRVLVQHRAPLLRIGIERALKSHMNVEVVEDGLPRSATDVLLTDLASAVGLKHDEALDCAPRVVVVSNQIREQDIQRAIAAGVSGYLRQDCEPADLVDCVRQVARGGRYLGAPVEAALVNTPTREPLTRREREVLTGMVKGDSNKRIAADLGIGVETVKRHMKAVLSKLDSATRTEAAATAQMRGLV